MSEVKGQCPWHTTNTTGSDSYVFNSSKGVGKCHSCDLSTWQDDQGRLWGRHSKREKPKLLQWLDTSDVLEGISGFDDRDYQLTETGAKSGAYLPLRGITRDTMEFFGVLTYEETSGKTYQEYLYPTGGIKVRYFPKEFSAKNGFKGDELFGMNLFPAGCNKVVTITEGECFTPDAEVFTPSGWVSLKDYTGQQVLQVYEDKSAGFTVPLAVVEKEYKGDLVEYTSGSYYSLTTPEHNLVREHPKQGLKKFKAGNNSTFKIPRTFNHEDAQSDLSTLEAKIWIMLSADFTFRGKGDIYGAFKKERKAERAKKLLDQYGVRYSVNKDSRGYWSFFIHRNHNLGFAKKDLPFCLSWHKDKEELLKEVIFWDGNYVKTRNQAEFSSNRKHNIDVVQMLAHSCGYVSTIINRSNEHGSWMKASILFGKDSSRTYKGHKRVPYSGKVMCLTVRTGMLVVRQKGSISISGNCDAMSSWQMLRNGSYVNPVVSFPSANPSGKFWEKNKKYLDSFDKIILSVDNDEPGQKLAEKVSEIFPDKTFIMNHGELKDANDFLKAGLDKEYKSAWWNAKKYKPDSILSDSEDYLKLYEDSPDFEYFTTGIEDLDEKMLGICKGYVTLVQAETGLGKTEFCRYLEWRALTTSSYKIAAMHLEENKLRSLLGLVSYKLNQNVTIKKFIDENGLDHEVREAIKEISESERFVTFDFDMQGGHEELIKQVRYLVAAMGVDFIFVEPIQDCVTGTASEKESKLSDLITQLSTLASKLNVGIVVVAHQNSEGGSMYSSMITKRAAFELLLKRDRDSDDPVEKNRTHVVIGRKNRAGLGNGPAGALDFDLESFTLKPVEKPKEPKVKHREDDF